MAARVGSSNRARDPDARAHPAARGAARPVVVLALALLTGLVGSACERAEEKIGRMGETASRQIGRNVTENKERADNALDEPFQRVQEAADEKMTNVGDSVDDASRSAIDGGLEGAERAARSAASSQRFDSAGASDEFDSPWADKPAAAE